jgi:hypothetical protein
LIGVTVGSLQVTCSRLGISLRRVVFNNGMGLLRRGGPHNGTSTHTARGRRVKFTPQVIENIKDFLAEGMSRGEIANRLGVTVGSLQVTCSRLGISLRRIISPNGSRRHTADVRPGSVGIAHVGEQKEVSQPEACGAVGEQKEVSQPEACGAPVGKFALTMRCHSIEQTSDIPLSLAAIEVLALEATSRDLGVAELIGQTLVAAINKDMIHTILRD